MTNLHQPETPKPAIRSVLIALMLAIFLGALDQTIVAVSMPAISAQFKDVSLLAWVISGYMVAMTVAVPIYGKLGDLYGRRKLMLFGMGLFPGVGVLRHGPEHGATGTGADLPGHRGRRDDLGQPGDHR